MVGGRTSPEGRGHKGDPSEWQVSGMEYSDEEWQVTLVQDIRIKVKPSIWWGRKPRIQFITQFSKFS
jgi:hypothetical protein